MKTQFLVSCFSLAVIFAAWAQPRFTSRTPDRYTKTMGEVVTESSMELPQRQYRLETFKTPDGGTATFLKYDYDEPACEADIQRYAVSLFPNPATDLVTITIGPAPMVETILEITDMSGRVISKMPLQNAAKTTVDVRNLRPGVYFITVREGKHLLVQKFIKQ